MNPQPNPQPIEDGELRKKLRALALEVVPLSTGQELWFKEDDLAQLFHLDRQQHVREAQAGVYQWIISSYEDEEDLENIVSEARTLLQSKPREEQHG